MKYLPKISLRNKKSLFIKILESISLCLSGFSIHKSKGYLVKIIRSHSTFNQMVVILVVLTERVFRFSLIISQLLAKAIPVRGAIFEKPAFEAGFLLFCVLR
ncbi:hypothetical protein FMJ31_17875 [Klebsiella michiganensis]|nr:hypothetical protein [Klebsiella michiganensis]MBZ7479059.1 hypothetical protein [Klebsiella michiganensis]